MCPDVPGTLQRADAAFFPGGHRRAARGREPTPKFPKKWGWRGEGKQQERCRGLQRSRGERAAGRLLQLLEKAQLEMCRLK